MSLLQLGAYREGRQSTEHELGALAQAARNYMISKSNSDLAVLDRLAAQALRRKSLRGEDLSGRTQ